MNKKNNKKINKKTEIINDETTDIITDAKFEPEFSENDMYKIVDLYYEQPYCLIRHQVDAFNKFMKDDLPRIFMEHDNIFYEKIDETKVYRHRFQYDDFLVSPPMYDNEEKLLYPVDAMLHGMSYTSKITATVTQLLEIEDIATGEKEVKVIGKEKNQSIIAQMPVMIKSQYCNLNLNPNEEQSKVVDEHDPGGYFIANGNEKVVMSVERMCDNKPLVFMTKESSGNVPTVQVKSNDNNGSLQVISIKYKKGSQIIIRVPIFKEIPIFVLLRAFGLSSDKEIIESVIEDSQDTNMINLLRYALDSFNKTSQILTQEQAIKFLVDKIKTTKKYTATDKNIKNKQKIKHLELILTKTLFPHLLRNKIVKAKYICYMLNQLLSFKLGRREPDDRDKLSNKRIDTVDALLERLVRQHYTKVIKECNKYFKAKNGDNDEKPMSIIHQIKPNIIEQGIKTALMTGTWGNKSTKGVAQALQRTTYIKVLSDLRKVITTNIDASSKQTGPRQAHVTQWGYLCPSESPEGHKVGLVKQLAMGASICLSHFSQVGIIKDLIRDLVLEIADMTPSEIHGKTKIFINGCWEYVVKDDAFELAELIRKSRTSGKLEKTISIVHQIMSKEIWIYTDGGRYFRPLLRVKNNKLVLKKKHVDKIKVSEIYNYGLGSRYNPIGAEEISGDKINSWQELLATYPEIIEYMDVEESETIMCALDEEELNHNKILMNSPPVNEEDTELASINRYGDNFYLKYTHMEIWAGFIVGETISNVPFLNHNQSPRLSLQFAQAKQAIGIPMTNYRHRLDITYVMFNPQRPIVETRAARYINSDALPAGENLIVAIMIYMGYNQEDAVIVNQTAIDRGLLNVTLLKKENQTLKRNMATSKDELFTKPDKTKVQGMGDEKLYEKLNDKGYAPEETELMPGDKTMGKIVPTQQIGNNPKMYKDNSTAYKSSRAVGTVDKVFTGIVNSDGYQMYKMRIRSCRVLQIGDKICSRSAQKTSVGLTLNQADMPFTESGIVPDIIITPHAFPARMTMSHILEVVVGKLGAHNAAIADGSSFRNIDMESIYKELEDNGFNRYGLETMYCGITGRKMQAQIYIGPTYYQRLKHIVADKIHCLTMDHEVLTNHGWKYFDKINDKDKIACLKDNKLVYDKALEKLYYPDYEGELYHIKSDKIDLTTTTNHRMFVSTDKEHFEPKLASDIIGKEVWYKNQDEIFSSVDAIEKVYTSKEPVFCLRVPSEVFYVRRNKKAVWTCNSRSRGPRALLTRRMVGVVTVQSGC